MNQHIYSFINHYINLETSPEYALLISGKWGSGKTFFINNYLDNEIHNNVKFIKISLFGTKSVDEVHKQIIFQLIGTEEGSIANSIAKISATVLDSFGKKINLGLNDIPIEQVLKKLSKQMNKEIIFIFDDLERVAINIPEVLGYINILVEKLQLKTILLANESELNKKIQYEDFKEKIIGKTFSLKQDFNASFNSFTELSKESKTVIIDNKSLIENIFNVANYHNLRHVRQTLLDFEYFFENIEDKFRSHKNLLQELIEIFFAFSIEVKNGQFKIEDLKDFQLVESVDYYMEKREADEQEKEFKRKPLDLFLDKYSLANRENLLLTEKMWIELFKFGILNKETVSDCFNNSKYFIKSSPQDWIPLWHYHELEDDEFQEQLKAVVENFNNNIYTQHEILMHVVGILLKFSKIGLFNISSKNIVTQAKKNIDKNLELWKNSVDVNLDDSSFGLGYLDIDSNEFQEIKDYLLNKTFVAINMGLDDIGIELIALLENNDFKGFEARLSPKSFVSKLYELPVFSAMNVNNFFNAILNIKHSTFRPMLLTIQMRYNQNYINELLINELEFWQDFEKLLDQELPKLEKTIKGEWLNIYKDKIIKDKIIDKLQKAKDNKALNQTDKSVG